MQPGVNSFRDQWVINGCECKPSTITTVSRTGVLEFLALEVACAVPLVGPPLKPQKPPSQRGPLIYTHERVTLPAQNVSLIAFSEMLYPEAPKPSQRDQQGALTFQ
jgi:hypothetical protein